MNKKEISFEDMSKNCKVYEEAEVPYHNEPLVNSYEAKKPESDGFNQSGFRPAKG